jgi:hypothetical protein
LIHIVRGDAFLARHARVRGHGGMHRDTRLQIVGK